MITKEILDSWYNIGAEPDGRPAGRPEVRLHYVRSVVEPYIKARLDRVKEIFTLNESHKIIIIGAGYGWGVEYLDNDFTVRGTEIDQYYLDTGAMDDYEEVKAAIESVGLDTTHGRGLELLNRFHTPGPRANRADLIDNEDSFTKNSRDRVLSKIGNATHVITEDVIPGLSNELTDSLCQCLKGYGGEVIHVGGNFTPEIKEIVGDQPLVSSRGIM